MTNQTDLSKKLRLLYEALEAPGNVFDRRHLLLAADEIELYYGGMLAWKATAEAKDAAALSSQPTAPIETEHCMCQSCRSGTIHASDCSVHNEPAEMNGLCDCKPTPSARLLSLHSAFCAANEAEDSASPDRFAVACVELKAEVLRLRASLTGPASLATSDTGSTP